VPPYHHTQVRQTVAWRGRYFEQRAAQAASALFSIKSSSSSSSSSSGKKQTLVVIIVFTNRLSSQKVNINFQTRTRQTFLNYLSDSEQFAIFSTHENKALIDRTGSCVDETDETDAGRFKIGCHSNL
jgi:hypothetical protein